MRGLRVLAVIFAIEFLDELVFGSVESAWPLVRDGSGLSYIQIGMLLSIPGIFSNVIEPLIGIAGDVWNRRRIILLGGILMSASLVLFAAAHAFWVLLLSFLIMYPASGAFVSLSQANLMDSDPSSREKNMAKWALSGSAGSFLGPLLISLCTVLAIGWRPVFAIFGGILALLAMCSYCVSADTQSKGYPSFRAGVMGSLSSLKKGAVIRWLILLQFSDLMLDVLFAFLALYFVDVVGASPAIAAAAVGLWTGVGLVGDFLVVRLLHKFPGITYLRMSAVAVLFVFPAFLLVPNIAAKLALVGMLGLLNAGWYSILKAKLYDALPGKSGTVLAVSNVGNIAGAAMVLLLGLAAENLGLGLTMWFLMAGPIVLTVGLLNTGGKTDEHA